jgi:hypothetical protein
MQNIDYLDLVKKQIHTAHKREIEGLQESIARYQKKLEHFQKLEADFAKMNDTEIQEKFANKIDELKRRFWDGRPNDTIK